MSRAIAAIAPSGAYRHDRFTEGLALAEAAGLQVVPLPGTLAPHRYLANTDAQRLHQLIEAFTSPAYDAVWAIRGGYGVTRILDQIPIADLPHRPFMGFSDLTPLLNALAQAGHPRCLHGPVIHSMGQTLDVDRQEALVALQGGPLPALNGSAWVGGEAEGRLWGGNLTLLASTCGTPDQLNAQGGLLFLEEIAEPPYRVDRSLQQLAAAGVFDGVVGVALGEFTRCDPPARAEWTLREILEEALTPLGIPVLAELPFGHGQRNKPLLVGATYRIQGNTLAPVPDRSTS